MSTNSNASWNYVNPWINYRSTSNTFNPSYINGYVDISGNVIVRNGFVYIVTQDLSLNGNVYIGNTYVGTSITAGNITAINTLKNSGNLTINGNLAVVNNNYNYTNTINGNLYIQSSTTTSTMNGNLYVTGNLSIPVGNLYVGGSTNTTKYPIAYMQNQNNVNFGGINNILLQNISNVVSGYLAGNAINTSTVQYGSTILGSNALQLGQIH